METEAERIERTSKFINPLDESNSTFETGGSDQVDAAETSNDPKSGAIKGTIDATLKALNMKKIQKFVDSQLFGVATLDDLDDDDNLEQHKRECCGLLHPRTSTSTAYDIVQMIALMYIVAVVPWRIAFSITYTHKDPLFWVDLVIDLTICFDIGLNFFRYYNDPQTGRLVTDRKEIRSKYLRSWFLIDLASVLPFDVILDMTMNLFTTGSTESENAKLLRLGRLARIARMMRLTKVVNLRKIVVRVNNYIRMIGVSKPALEFIGRLLFLSAFVCFNVHLCGSLWIDHSRSMTLKGVFPNWYSEEYRHLMCNDTDASGTIDDHEVLGQLESLAHPDNWTVYIDGCYWILTTMSTVGYGDIVPHTASERLFGMLVILLGAFVWAFIIASFNSTLHNLDRDKAKYDESLRAMRAMMRFQDVPESLTVRVEEYFEYKYDSKTLYDDTTLYDVLPVRLRSDLMLHRYKDIISAIPFFRGCHEGAILDIVAKFKSFSVLPLNYLFHKDDPSIELVVLTKGRMAVVQESNPGHHSLASVPELRGKTGGEEDIARLDEAAPAEEKGNLDVMEMEYSKGAYFGENEFLGMGRCRTCTVRARTFCEVSTLHPDDMAPVLQIHLRLKRRLEHYSKLKSEMETRMLAASADATSESLMLAIKSEIEATWEQEGLELREAFETADIKKTGFLDRDDIRTLAHEMGKELHQWELDEAMRHMDTNGSGTVDFEEFSAWWGANDAKLDFTTRGDLQAKTMRGIQHSILENQTRLSARIEQIEEKMSSELVAIREALEVLTKKR